MVIKLFNKLFNIRDKTSISEPKGFRQDTSVQDKLADTSAKPQDPTATEEVLTSDSVDVAALFYSLLFPTKSNDTGGIANNLEKAVMDDVENALMSPQDVADKVLKLPSKLTELDRRLKDESVDIKVLVDEIHDDPVLSVEVIKLCNSPLFKRGDREVTSLQQAFVQLGRDQLRRLVTTCMVREMIVIKPIYYRRFGLQIWRHSMQVAYLSSELAADHSDQDPDTAFLLGLLHDVGKIAIFKMLLDEFQIAEPGEQPSSWLFRQVMTTKSLSLSALLAQCWHLPVCFESSLSQLANLDSTPTEPLAALVWRANLISECSMLYHGKKLDEPCLARLLIDANLSRDEFEVLHEKLKEV
ncbi:HDOD domain-containing protein [Shewanella psychropiezotolerans]|uniref:HDOD domain-containing protein n=1 Tax=Shewanella psychropiezotolerans TaxID=2593655 RepID=A0ABX5WSV5_9GAMM|nr:MULTISPECIES: HDOD domain-containing protein [Shewanella]MPY26388.1 HDOD domain-containing protein [Shewanella sp. YLB-07]QDO81901.1 HDOD domain-containing protein [Shewanella psychropiezotolerans]